MATADATGKPSKFLTHLGDAARRHGHADVAADELVLWCRRFILFHGKQHPQEMGRAEIGIYLEHVAKTKRMRCARSTGRGGRWSFCMARSCNVRWGSCHDHCGFWIRSSR